jgi:hypothetical protein
LSNRQTTAHYDDQACIGDVEATNAYLALVAKAMQDPEESSRA